MDTKTICLGILTLANASGYDIRKHLEENFGHFMDVSSNAVYPALKALEKEGLVFFKTVKQNNYPAKKIYSLTDEGRKVWTKTLIDLPPRHRVRSEFMLLMFFAETLSTSRIQEIMAERLEELNHWTKVCEEWLQSGEGKQAGAGPHFLTEYAMALMDAETSFIKKNTDKLIKQLHKKGGKKK